MTDEGRIKIISNDFVDAITEYKISPEEINVFQSDTVNFVDEKNAVIYFSKDLILKKWSNAYTYAVIPKIFGLVDTAALEEIGVTKVQGIPYLSLQGQDILLGFLDTGIDYTSPLFQYENNTTRIVEIWDQTIVNMDASPEIFYYGEKYNRYQINEALDSDNPMDIVPSVDEVGHGTLLAGLAGGSWLQDEEFRGVATKAEFLIVKLKQAKQTIKDYFLIPEGTLCYQENDIMLAISYLVNKARMLERPIIICLGIGSNQGGHDGTGKLAEMLLSLSTVAGIGIVIASGNEGNSKHHYFGEIDNKIGYDTVELNVGENESGFTMELWGNVPGVYSIDILSPSGQYVPRMSVRQVDHRTIPFILDNTTIVIDGLLIESQSGDQLIMMRFQSPSPGTWSINVYSGPTSSGFHIWLPMNGFISPNTYFLDPSPDTTITNPGNSIYPLTIVPYNYITDSIYINASRGYTRTGIIKPDLAAPGVNILGPSANGTFSLQSGSCIGAALTAGVVALLFEWGIIRGNDRLIDTVQVKKYLIHGVERNANIKYPNNIWGYGVIDIYGTFVKLSGDEY